MNLFTKIALAMLFVVFALWYFTNQSRIKLKENNKIIQVKLNSSDSALKIANLSLQYMEEALTKTDTTISYKMDSISFVYESELSKKDKLIAQYTKERPEPIITEDTTTHTKTLKQSFKKNNVSVFLVAKYIGEFKGFTLEWNFPEVQIDHSTVVKVPVPYEVVREVPVNKREIWLSGQVLFIEKPYTFIGIDYLGLKGVGYGASIDPFNKVYSANVKLRLFRF